MQPRPCTLHLALNTVPGHASYFAAMKRKEFSEASGACGKLHDGGATHGSLARVSWSKYGLHHVTIKCPA